MIRKTTIALIIIAIIGWLFWIGLSISSGIERGILKAQIETLEKAKADLEKQVEDFSKRISMLEKDYFKLKSDYDKLESDYRAIKADYESLKGSYEKLISDLEKGKAIAESASWISEDKRLQVKSELIPEYLFEKIVGYSVNVTITNVGKEPLKTVWIFLFPYVDGKLEMSYPYYHRVENIYVGESYSYLFKFLPKEMTSYKVLALGSL